MKDIEIAALIREEFPAHSKTAYSLAKRTRDTGVMLCPRAREIRDEALKQRRKPNRKKAVHFNCRLSDALACRVLQKMGRENITKQELLEKLLREWVEADVPM